MIAKVIKFLIDRKVFAFFLMIILFIAGVYSATLLPRESQPKVNVPIVNVKTVYLGAKAEDIEKEITSEIESEVSDIENIKNIFSISSDNYSVVTVEFEQGSDIDKKETEVQKAVDKAKNKFSKEVDDPTVEKVEITNKPVYVFSVSSNENDFIFKNNSEKIKKDLEKIDGVGEVVYTGSSDFQYSLYLDTKKIKAYNISALQVFSILKNSDIKTPIGSLELENITYPIETNSQIKNIEDLENIILMKKDDALVYLKDVAFVKKEFTEESNFSTTYLKDLNKKKRSTIFYVSKKQDYNVEDVVDRVKKYLDEESKKNIFLKKENTTVLVDWGFLIKDDLLSLTKNGLLTTFLVFIILLFILGFKDSLIAAFGIPFSFALAFIAFLFFGNTLNFISLFSLILSIGILVDSDIVMSEGIEKKIKDGLSKEDASVEAVKELATPMIAGTLTTVAVFAPLMFLSGTTGEFIKSIPFTVIFVIIASQFVSILAIPVLHAANYDGFSRFLKRVFKVILVAYFIYIIFSFLKISYNNFLLESDLNFNFWKEINKKDFLFSFFGSFIILLLRHFYKKFNLEKQGDFNALEYKKEYKKNSFYFWEKIKNKFKKDKNKKTLFEKIENKYEFYLLKIIKSFWLKLILILVAFSFFAFAIYLPKSGKIKSQFFPGGEVLFLSINISMPDGSTKKDTKEYISDVSKFLKKEEHILDFISTVGSTSTFSKKIKQGERYGNIFIKIDNDAQENGQEFTENIQNKLKEKDFKYASAEKSEDGPPSGAPISFNVVGDKKENVQKYAVEAEKILEKINGVVNIETDLEKLKTSFYFDINKAKMKMLGVNESDIYTLIRMTTEGVELFDIYDKYTNDDIKVVFLNNENRSKKLDDFRKISPEKILELKVKNNLNEDVYLSEFMTIRLKKYQSKIYHYDEQNSIKIEAENKNNFNLNDIVFEFKEKFAKINNKEEVELIFGGAFSEQQKNFAETGIIFLAGIVIVFAILIFYFNSLWIPLLVESVILFAYTGSTIGLWLTGNSISFPSIIGLIALSGVVVNNSIMLIHSYNEKNKRYIKNKILDKNIFNSAKEEIVIEGSSERLRPIILTVVTTVVGIFPLIFSSPIWAPIAYVIIFGLLFSTFITLFFIPVVYFWTYDYFIKKNN